MKYRIKTHLSLTAPLSQLTARSINPSLAYVPFGWATSVVHKSLVGKRAGGCLQMPEFPATFISPSASKSKSSLLSLMIRQSLLQPRGYLGAGTKTAKQTSAVRTQRHIWTALPLVLGVCLGVASDTDVGVDVGKRALFSFSTIGRGGIVVVAGQLVTLQASSSKSRSGWRKRMTCHCCQTTRLSSDRMMDYFVLRDSTTSTTATNRAQ